MFISTVKASFSVYDQPQAKLFGGKLDVLKARGYDWQETYNTQSSMLAR